MAAYLARLAQCVDDPLGHPDRRRGVLGVLHDDGELVAAEPSEQFGRAQAGAQPFGDDDQYVVASLVSQRVVDLLEAVQVQQEQRRRLDRCAWSAVVPGPGWPE
nr:hypothetical protein GCM10020092_037020 [Actinoplanes digitatis]